MLQLYFGQTPVINQSFIPIVNTQSQNMALSWVHDVNKLYTIIFYDMDVPSLLPSNTNLNVSTQSPYLNYMVVDVPGQNISQGRELMAYQGPYYQGWGEGIHSYFVDVYEQSGIIKAKKRRVRAKSNLRKFVKDNNLNLIGSVQFYVGTQPNILNGPRVGGPNITDLDYFITDTSLTEPEQKYCRCVLHVSANQTGECLKQNSLGQLLIGDKCSNPYAICAKNVGITSRECGNNYNYNKISDNELLGYAILSKIPIPEPYNRIKMLENIVAWKISETI